MDSTLIPVVSNTICPSDPKPHTIVLQPTCNLDHTSVQDFQLGLDTAIDQAGDAVIIDFLWVEKADAQGVAVLVAGIERAAVLGKSISFHSMNTPTRVAMEAEWDRQREVRLSNWTDDCVTELEQFLDKRVR